MKIPGAPFGPGTPEPGRSDLSGSKKPHEKTSANVQRNSGAADQARLGKESAAEASKSLSRQAVDAADRAANSRAANGRAADSRDAGSRPGTARWAGRAAAPAGNPAAENRAAGNPVNPVAGQTARPAAARTEQAGTDSLRNLLSALKLPNDSLSEHIVSFSRYFSLPLEHSSIGALRREVLVQKKREAAALGAAAAADKGLVLESRALEEYAGAIDPAEWREQPQPEQQPEQPETPERHSPGAGGGKDENAKKEPTAEDIKRKVTAVLEKGPVPDFINRIPGKNGRRWLVIPFSFSTEGIDLRASFRVLLPDPAGKDQGAGRFAADIAVFREKKLSRRWFFLLEGKSGKEFKAQRAEFSVSPPVGRKTFILINELATMFGLSGDNVLLKRESTFADSRNDLLLTIDEEV